MAERKTIADKQRVGVNAGTVAMRSLLLPIVFALSALGLPAIFGTSLASVIASASLYSVAGLGAINTAFVAIRKAINLRKYNNATNFEFNEDKVIDDVKYDKELQYTENLINDVIAHQGLDEHGVDLQSKLMIATNMRKELQTDKVGWFKRRKMSEELIVREDYIKKVIASRMDRLAELCEMRKRDWAETNKYGRTGRRLDDATIQARETEILMIQKFLNTVVNKSGNQEPYYNIIKKKINEHRDVIELWSPRGDASNEYNDAARLIKTLIKQHKTKKAINMAYADAESELDDVSIPATDRFEKELSSVILNDARYNADRIEQLRKKAEHSLGDIKGIEVEIKDIQASIRKLRDDLQDEVVEIVDDLYDNLRKSNTTIAEIENISKRAKNQLENLKGKNKKADGILEKMQNDISYIANQAVKAKQARIDAQQEKNRAKQNADMAERYKNNAKKSATETRKHEKRARTSADNTEKIEEEAEISLTHTQHAEEEAGLSAMNASKAEDATLNSAHVAEEHAVASEKFANDSKGFSEQAEKYAQEAERASEHAQDMEKVIELVTMFIEQVIRDMKKDYIYIKGLVTSANEDVKKFEELVQSGKLEQAEELSDKVSNIYTELVQEISGLTATIAKQVNTQICKRLERLGLDKKSIEEMIAEEVKTQFKTVKRTTTLLKDKIEKIQIDLNVKIDAVAQTKKTEEEKGKTITTDKELSQLKRDFEKYALAIYGNTTISKASSVKGAITRAANQKLEGDPVKTPKTDYDEIKNSITFKKFLEDNLDTVEYIKASKFLDVSYANLPKDKLKKLLDLIVKAYNNAHNVESNSNVNP